MNKKDAIRTYLSNSGNDAKFNLESLANWVNDKNRRNDITPKDVSNVVLPLFKNGALTREYNKSTKRLVYTVISNNVALWFAKHPIGVQKPKPAPEKNTLAAPWSASRRKNRTPMIRAIDDEIEMLRGKIKKLESWKREYAA